MKNAHITFSPTKEIIKLTKTLALIGCPINEYLEYSTLLCKFQSSANAPLRWALVQRAETFVRVRSPQTPGEDGKWTDCIHPDRALSNLNNFHSVAEGNWLMWIDFSAKYFTVFLRLLSIGSHQLCRRRLSLLLLVLLLLLLLDKQCLLQCLTVHCRCTKKYEHFVVILFNARREKQKICNKYF